MELRCTYARLSFLSASYESKLLSRDLSGLRVSYFHGPDCSTTERRMANDRTPHERALPNHQNAVIPREKLERYSLDSAHVSSAFGKSSGKDKARVFKAVLGFVKEDWELLKNCILEELPYSEATVEDEDEHGKRYTVTVSITGPSGNTAAVLTAWIIKRGTDFPTLISARCRRRGR